jgi:hydrogenase maturation protease
MSDHHAVGHPLSENEAANPVARPTVVLGLGNAIMGDDGAGLVALEELRALQFKPEVRFVYGGVWGLALLADIETAGSLLLLDAVHAGAQPGAVVVLEGEAIPRFLSMKISPHQVDVRELLALAELRDALPQRLALVGVQIAQADLSTDLSPEVLAAIPAMRERALDLLSQWGHALASPRSGPG